MTLALGLDPQSILESLSPYGEIGLVLTIFAETGLLSLIPPWLQWRRHRQADR